MTVCNACRYCEQFCPVFPAMEQRPAFTNADLAYLANLCHNCGECLYACQYAPPHEFGITVPRTLAGIRALSYEEHCWPRPLGAAFRRHNLLTGAGLAAGLIAVLFASTMLLNADGLRQVGATGDFYAVVPHRVMVALFGSVALFVLLALGVGGARFWRAARGASGSTTSSAVAWARTVRDVATLRHLHGGGVDCPSGDDARAPWRRWLHHCTAYGFLLCVASTSVAAVYHNAFGWRAPYDYASLPVLLGTAGGLGLLVGPAGLAILRRRRDAALGDPEQHGLDESFLALLFLTSITGLAVLVTRHRPVMGMLLIVHLGSVLALFATMPYGKFVHGLYRMLALARFHREGEDRSRAV
jgi:citrate/tricarballylate utilization protein